jgi:hypothetical protein
MSRHNTIKQDNDEILYYCQFLYMSRHNTIKHGNDEILYYCQFYTCLGIILLNRIMMKYYIIVNL